MADFSRFAPGLFATTLLGDLGADVVQVEPPSGGRSDLPLYPTNAARGAGQHPFFRNRRSVVLDLRAEKGRSAAHALIRNSDVVVEGFRPGVADRIGIGFESAQSLNPSIVYCSITGFGQQGEGARRPGHDINYVAESGLLSHTTRSAAEPGIPSNVVADLAGGGLAAAFQIASAVVGQRGGAPAQYLDVAMVRSVLAMVAPLAAMMRVDGPDPAGGAGLLNGAAPFYRVYRTSDDRFVAVGAIEPKFFAVLCDVIGRPELVADQMDVAAWPAMHRVLEETLGACTRDHWELALRDAAVTAVLSTEEAFERAADAGWSPVDLGLSPEPVEARRYSREPGSDSSEVLAELGLAGH